MEILRVTLAIGLPWGIGIAFLLAVWRHWGPGAWPLVLGFGYPVGVFSVILSLKLQDWAGLGLNYWRTVVTLCFALLALLPFAVRNLRAGTAPGLGVSAMRAWGGLKALHRLLIILLLGAICIRFGGLSLEHIWRPLFGWDAWYAYAPRARVWWEYGFLVPITQDLMVTGPQLGQAFPLLAGASHPDGIPLVMLWMTMALDRWDDGRMLLPWFVLGGALLCAFFGQARSMGMSVVIAMVFTWALASAPFFATHVALGGYLDLWLSAYLFLLFAGIWRSLGRQYRDGCSLLALGVVGALVTKSSGVFLVSIFIVACVFALLPRKISAFSLGGGAIAGAVLVLSPGMNIFSWLSGGRFRPEGFDLFEFGAIAFGMMFLDLSWHLLWWLFPFAWAFAAWQSWANRQTRYLLIVTAIALAATLAVFAVTHADTATSLNRVLLNVLPLYVLVLAAGFLPTRRSA
jgi:hypothetical protein